ncbi:MAG: hypothetical protein AB7V77_00965 [Candidatus Woesearchaeota archaeon]
MVNLDKILLTINARDFCDSQGRSLKDYKFKRFKVYTINSINYLDNEIEKNLPKRVIAVVDYKIVPIPNGSVRFIAYGTAIIPKV